MRIKRQEAAALLGCSPQTITNLADRGVLSIEKIGKWHYFNRKEVLSLIPKADGVREAEKALAEVEAELYRERADRVTEVMMHRARREFIGSLCDVPTFHRYADLVAALYDSIEASALLGERMKDSERETIRQIVNLQPLGEIANRLHTSEENVRRTFDRALRRMIHFSRDIGNNMRTLREERDSALERCRELRGEVSQLRLAEKERTVTGQSSQYLLNTDVRDVEGFSVRLVNGLRRAGIRTVKDLVRQQRHEIARIQNIGARCLSEIDRFFSRYSLTYGMTINELKKIDDND